MKNLLLCTILFLFVSATSAQDFQAFVLQPPEKILNNVKKISVLEFTGEKGKVLTEYLGAALLESRRGIYVVSGGFFSSSKVVGTYLKGARTNVFDLVERTQLDKVLQEQNLSNSGIVDDGQAASVGKVLGIDAIITGSVSYTYKDEHRTDKKTDYTTNKTYNVSCTKRTVTAEARMKIISVSTGQVIGTKTASSTFYEDKCGEQRSGISSPSSIADNCVKSIASSLSNYFCPVFVLSGFDFEKIKNKEYKDKAKQAKQLIKDNNLAGAFAIYKAIYDNDPYCAEAADATANLYSISGNFEKAKELWLVAAEIDAKYQKDLQWVNRQIEMNQMLENLGITIEKGEYSSSSEALADKVTTRGNKGDRYEVKKEANEGAETVAKVPGDTEFTVLKDEGTWVLIKLLGGKQGYILKASVK